MSTGIGAFLGGEDDYHNTRLRQGKRQEGERNCGMNNNGAPRDPPIDQVTNRPDDQSTHTGRGHL